MLIGIEASRANRLKKTGVEWYAYHVIQELKRLPDSAPHTWFLYGNDPLAQGLERGPGNWHERRLAWPPKYLWTQGCLTLEMVRRPPDVLFVPAHVLPRALPRRSVVTIHDVGFHRYPELYKWRQVAYHEWTTKDIVRRATRIITISEFSKQEIMEIYGARPEQIIVTHLGLDHDRYRPMPREMSDTLLARWNLQHPFFLFIGRLEKKKNVIALIEAFSAYKRARGGDDPVELLLVGPPGVGYAQIEQAILASTDPEAIKLAGYVSEQEKIALLSRATALVHPAFYEGFGLTPLEAMACGCPVICSRAASLPEVVGIENALWFDPWNTEQLAAHMDHLVHDPTTREALAARGRLWVKRYTWPKTAQRTLRALTDFS